MFHLEVMEGLWELTGEVNSKRCLKWILHIKLHMLCTLSVSHTLKEVGKPPIQHRMH